MSCLASIDPYYTPRYDLLAPWPPRVAEGSNGTLPSVGYVLLKAEVLERPPDATGRLV